MMTDAGVKRKTTKNKMRDVEELSFKVLTMLCGIFLVDRLLGWPLLCSDGGLP